MKILYAATRRKGAAEQLNRILQGLQSDNHLIKVSAYEGIETADWNLDALLNIFEPNKISFENDNFEIYYEQVKFYTPDLIISDLEPFTSYIANVLNIPIIQISPKLVYEGMTESDKYAIGIRKTYPNLFNKHTAPIFKNMVDNADCVFAYSHLCDLEKPPQLKDKFEYIRPYYVLGQISITCKHDIVAISPNNHRGMIRLLQSFDDAVLFSDFLGEAFPRIILKSSSNISEYACNLRNSNYIINRGSEEHLADAFYNGKFSWIVPDFTDEEAVINSIINQHLGLAKMLYDLSQEPTVSILPKTRFNNDVLFLHERINDF